MIIDKTATYTITFTADQMISLKAALGMYCIDRRAQFDLATEEGNENTIEFFRRVMNRADDTRNLVFNASRDI
jgi:hypothetical protein